MGLPGVAAAADHVADGLPPDSLVVGFALFLLVAAGALQLSLGDIVADEAQLPSSVNLINKNRQRRSNFIKGKKRLMGGCDACESIRGTRLGLSVYARTVT